MQSARTTKLDRPERRYASRSALQHAVQSMSVDGKPALIQLEGMGTLWKQQQQQNQYNDGRKKACVEPFAYPALQQISFQNALVVVNKAIASSASHAKRLEPQDHNAQAQSQHGAAQAQRKPVDPAPAPAPAAPKPIQPNSRPANAHTPSLPSNIPGRDSGPRKDFAKTDKARTARDLDSNSQGLQRQQPVAQQPVAQQPVAQQPQPQVSKATSLMNPLNMRSSESREGSSDLGWESENDALEHADTQLMQPAVQPARQQAYADTLLRADSSLQGVQSDHAVASKFREVLRPPPPPAAPVASTSRVQTQDDLTVDSISPMDADLAPHPSPHPAAASSSKGKKVDGGTTTVPSTKRQATQQGPSVTGVVSPPAKHPRAESAEAVDAKQLVLPWPSGAAPSTSQLGQSGQQAAPDEMDRATNELSFYLLSSYVLSSQGFEIPEAVGEDVDRLLDSALEAAARIERGADQWRNLARK